MDIMKGLLERRSIRKYTNQIIPDDKIKEILESAMHAPSAANGQPWEFVVIKDKNILNEITKFHPYSNPLKQADCAIVVCGNLSKEIFKGLWTQDCSAATENILLAAHGLGIGSLWLGLYPEMSRVESLKKLINAPENIVPFSIVSLGYPAEEKSIESRYDEDKVHYDTW